MSLVRFLGGGCVVDSFRRVVGMVGRGCLDELACGCATPMLVCQVRC